MLINNNANKKNILEHRTSCTLPSDIAREAYKRIDLIIDELFNINKVAKLHGKGK